MTVEECYERLHGDYKQVLTRLMNKDMVERILLKFPADNSMDLLHEGIRNNDHEVTFRAVHTLKGVTAMLAFDELSKASSDLTEQLRGNNEAPDPVLLEKLEECYRNVIETIALYQSEKEN